MIIISLSTDYQVSFIKKKSYNLNNLFIEVYAAMFFKI